jgi:hypothetical protein
MLVLSKNEFDARARKMMPDSYDTLPRTEGLIFGMQVDVDHEHASGMKLRIGTIEDKGDKKTWVWAIVSHRSDVYFYKDHEKLSAMDLKQAELLEPMRTVAGQFKDPQANRLRSYICFLFMSKGAYGRFAEGKFVSFRGFEAACKRILDAKRNGFYNLESKLRLAEVDDGDKMDESEGEDGGVGIAQATLPKEGSNGNEKTGKVSTLYTHIYANAVI